jgi:hypothetical protein
MKQCTKCKVEKSLDSFPPNKRTKDQKCSWCRSCHSEKTRLYRLNNIDKVKESNRLSAQRPDQKEKARAREERNKEQRQLQSRYRTIQRKYGLTKKEYEALEAQQDYKCKICKTQAEDNNHGYLYVDHCHNSNQVRALLCQKCNSMLGYSRDRIDLLEKAIDYLKEYKIENKT